MAKTVVGLFDDWSTAQNVVQDLVNNGFAREDISVVANQPEGELATAGETDTGMGGLAAGAGTGAVLGGVAGLLVGLGALAIPGFGPILAAGPLAAALTGAGIGAVAGGMIGALVDLGVPEEEAEYYAEGVRRGGTLVTVKTDDNMVDRAVSIMNRHGAIDINRRAADWRNAGWTGFDADAETYTTPTGEISRYHSRGAGEGATLGATPTTTGRTETTGITDYSGGRNIGRTTETTAEARELKTGEMASIPVVEEDIQIGKREVERGGARVETRIEEKPVEKDVHLHEEHVTVERRPVDRPASEADFGAFREGSIEVRETAEVPVVKKEARVVEEVVVGKEAQERTETIRDTVRRTDVDVQEVDTSWQDTGYTRWDNDFRTYHTSRYGNTGRTYEQYTPAYRYGYTLANDPRYRDWDWNRVESHARTDWEQRGEGAWEDFKDSIRYAWDKVRGAR